MPKRTKTRKPARRIEVRESGVHGRGVYAAEFIAKGARIIEYAGQRILERRPERREQSAHIQFRSGKRRGNQSRDRRQRSALDQPSCDPNCEAIEEDDRIFIHAMRDIEPGRRTLLRLRLGNRRTDHEESKKEYECLCGSPDCRGTMLAL